MEYKFISGGICAPVGFTANGVCCGIKASNTEKCDLMMIKSDTLCDTAAIFTKNIVKAAPLIVTQKNISDGKAQAIIANSSNANCCNANGIEAAYKMCELAAQALDVEPSNVIVASTGVIGEPLPIERVKKGVNALKGTLSKENASKAAQAIMTTDTVKKEIAMQLQIDGKTVTIGCIAKGSGMIHINMGTMLSFVTTDISMSGDMLKSALIQAADETYNMVSVDGDTSTNDTLAILANGNAANKKICDKNEDYNIFVNALTHMFKIIAKQLAKDGEGATKLLVAFVKGAKTKHAAKQIAKSVCCSSLVKTAIFGADANWGRVLCAIGYSGIDADISKIDVSFVSSKGEIQVCKNGMGVKFCEDTAKEILTQDEITITVNLNDGMQFAQAYGCDLTYDYIKINGDYRT